MNKVVIVSGGFDPPHMGDLKLLEEARKLGDMLYVIETALSANVSDIQMYTLVGGQAVYLETQDVPDFYTNTITSSAVYAFKVPAIVGAIEVEYNLAFIAKSGKTIAGACYTTAYVGEATVNDDGKFIDWAVESDGDADYEATFDEDFYFA